jgi:hypothetical protein
MRTTIDLPDDLYRALKARAALRGMTVRDLVRGLIEQSLRQPSAGTPPRRGRPEPPPVIIPARGVPIAALSRSELRRLEEEDDEAGIARPARR